MKATFTASENSEEQHYVLYLIAYSAITLPMAQLTKDLAL